MAQTSAPPIATLRDIEEIERLSLEQRGMPDSTYELIRQSAERHPHKRAMTFLLQGDTEEAPFELTYAELLARVTQAANAFHHLGVRPGKAVSFLLPNLPHTHFTIWGGEAAGVVNAINPFTCGRLAKPFFDLNDNGKFDDDGVLSGGAYASSLELNVGMPGEAVIIGNRLVVGGSAGKVDDVRVNTGITPLRGRLSWRLLSREPVRVPSAGRKHEDSCDRREGCPRHRSHWRETYRAPFQQVLSPELKRSETCVPDRLIA